ncbi:MAG: GxxExxY protein [Gemmataceae bacterium]|nr:GxxExxY protein [Gemmataceae bacterium]
MAELLLKDEVFQIIGAAFEVYKELGCGFLEPVYQEALSIEFESRQVPFCAKKELILFYKGRQLKKTYEADFDCFAKIIVEIKALDRLSGKEEAQLLNYLKATGYWVGVLINFGAKGGLDWKRLVR